MSFSWAASRQADGIGHAAGPLRKLGVPSVRAARNGAWLSLVGSVHWKMLADLLGVADTTACAWHKENGGDRASYVASRLRQAHRTAGPE
ncbi:MAG: hypothetical protein ACRDSL_27055 [Pseudonocardiaceae bacterium]